MDRRQELCRNFQRGSCKYGAQCRYAHASPQQQQQQQQQLAKPNPFGFGTASRQQQQQQQPLGVQSQFQQQQKPNPYGFGVQGGAAGAQSRNAPGQAKPFQNKWVRDPSAPTKQAEAAAAQPPQAAHISCTDPESCRQQISEDFKNEAPLWKLTCYAHLRSGPCDITGDISFEELRAKAYEEGKQGHPLQSIVEGERNLQNAKLMEFTNLLNNARALQTPSFPTMGSVPEVKSNSSFGGSQTNGPPVFTSFSQIGPATNVGPGSRTTTPGVPTNTLFGQSAQPSPQPFAAPTFGAAQMKFGVPACSMNIRAHANGYRQKIKMNRKDRKCFCRKMQRKCLHVKFAAFGSQTSKQPSGSLQGSSMSSISNFPKSSAGYQQSPASSVQHRDIDRQSLELLNGMMTPTSAMDQAYVEDKKNENQDDSIWLKEKWAIGEIPLDEPPQRHISHVF